MFLNINDLEINKKYKYSEVCEVLGMSKLTGGARVYQLKELALYCNFYKEGHKIIFTEVFDKPTGERITRGKHVNSMNNNIKYKDILSPLEIINKFDGFYVYRHILGDEVLYVGKGCGRRVVNKNGRKYNMDEVTKEVVKRFDIEQDAIKFEEDLINYYKNIGQCKYNDDIYYVGLTRESKLLYKANKDLLFSRKINKEYEKMFKCSI